MCSCETQNVSTEHGEAKHANIPEYSVPFTILRDLDEYRPNRCSEVCGINNAVNLCEDTNSPTRNAI